MFLPRSPSVFRTTVRRKEIAMFTLLILAAVYGGYRAIRAAVDSLRALPRSNEDMIFY
jgi:hypothetical protein